MKITAQYLYELLPEYYRMLDGEHENPPLEAFIKILAREGGIVEDNITRLYENWFIETCDEWVVPYIGDLLGVKGVHEIEDPTVYSRRAYVANTLSYRRRKGTGPVLEQLALDITGWRARVVEFFQLLVTSQNLNHIRLHSMATADLRNLNALDLVNTAFEEQSHTIDVRRIATDQGKYNIQNIGLFIWRLQSYPLKGVDARKIEPGDGIPDGCYTFSPLGMDTQLFNTPQTERDIVHLAEEINVPGPLRRRALYDDLELANHRYFDEEYPPVFQLFVNGNSTPLQPEEIVICNLSNWHLPPPAKTVAIDPVLGRITFSNADTSKVSVHYNYGFSGDIGGGPYARKASLPGLNNANFDWHVDVGKDHDYETISEAVEAWNDLTEEQAGLITIMDNSSYHEDLTGSMKIEIPGGKQLVITAGKDLRSHVLGNIEVVGTGSNGGQLVINGLLLEGKVTVLSGNLGSLSIDHSTIVPNKGGLEIEESQEENIEVVLERSICGPMKIIPPALVSIEDSIIDFSGGHAVLAENSQLAIQNSTVFGKIKAKSLDASNCIFNDLLDITRKQIGCVRFSYVPNGSATPRQYRCQPELEIQTQIKERRETESPPIDEEAIKVQVLNTILPVFNSVDYGHHSYGQLGSATPDQITSGADNASEMGAFNFLQQPQRATNLKIALKEYLRLGLEAGIIYVT